MSSEMHHFQFTSLKVTNFLAEMTNFSVILRRICVGNNKNRAFSVHIKVTNFLAEMTNFSVILILVRRICVGNNKNRAFIHRSMKFCTDVYDRKMWRCFSHNISAFTVYHRCRKGRS